MCRWACISVFSFTCIRKMSGRGGGNGLIASSSSSSLSCPCSVFLTAYQPCNVEENHVSFSSSSLSSHQTLPSLSCRFFIPPAQSPSHSYEPPLRISTLPYPCIPVSPNHPPVTRDSHSSHRANIGGQFPFPFYYGHSRVSTFIFWW